MPTVPALVGIAHPTCLGSIADNSGVDENVPYKISLPTPLFLQRF
ncbi:hypothetical protein NUACC26_053910 [Scytonema sp. NUACC26]